MSLTRQKRKIFKSSDSNCKTLKLTLAQSKENDSELANKLGLNSSHVNFLNEEWKELGYYQKDLVSHFISMLAHKPSWTEVIDESMNITEILQESGFTKKKANYLQSAIKEDSLGLSLFHWISKFVQEKMVDNDTIPEWMTQPQQLGSEFNQTVKTTKEHFKGTNVDVPVRFIWINSEMLKTKIDEHGNKGLESDKYWYHSTTALSALKILQKGIKCEVNPEKNLHLGLGFYVSNNYRSANRYLKHAFKLSNFGVVFVYQWNDENQNSFNKRRLSVINDSEGRTEKIIEFMTDKYRSKEPNEVDHGLPYNYDTKYSLIMARDTLDKDDDPRFVRHEGDNQMCIRRDDAANAFTDCIQEVWLLPKTIKQLQDIKKP